MRDRDRQAYRDKERQREKDRVRVEETAGVKGKVLSLMEYWTTNKKTDF